jgi:hypothetical protein
LWFNGGVWSLFYYFKSSLFHYYPHNRWFSFDKHLMNELNNNQLLYDFFSLFFCIMIFLSCSHAWNLNANQLWYISYHIIHQSTNLTTILWNLNDNEIKRKIKWKNIYSKSSINVQI